MLENRFHSRESSKNYSSEELKTLIHGARHGDMKAFKNLYDYYITPIYRFVYFRVKNKETAEELTQIAFIKAWKALPGYMQKKSSPIPSERSFSSWLYTIARNTVIDFWKKKKEIHIEDNEEYFNQIEDMGARAQSLAEQNEKSDALKKAISTLSEDQQEITILKFIEELTNKEISEITGKKEDAIRQLQFRALKALRIYFKKNKAI